MKTLKLGIVSLALLVGGGALILPQRALAAPGFNVITSPLPIKINTTPGQTVQTELRMKNQGDQAEGIKVGLMRFSASGTNGQPELFNLTAKDTYASWVHFTPQVFTAEPNVWMSINMAITVPNDAALGYYLAVTFSPASQPGVPQVTSLKGTVATLVLLNVQTGSEKRALSITSLTADHSLYEYLPANFNISVRNSGNIFVAPAGNIFILKGGKTIDVLDFNTAGGSVLPSSSRIFTVPWTNGFPLYVPRIINGKTIPDNHDKPKESLKWDFATANHFRFGKYTAKLLVVYDNGTSDVPLEAEVSFWVVPWKLMLVLLVVVSIIGFGIYSAVRSGVQKSKTRYKRSRRHGSKK